MMKTKMQKKREQRELTGDKPTKKYNEVAQKIRKMLSATAQTFIPELAEALKQDWFPTMPHTELQKNKGIRDAIRDKIFNDWSYDSRFSYSKDNVWNDATIMNNLPKWLKHPSDKYTMEAARTSKFTQKNVISEQEKKKIDQIAETLSDEVIEPEEYTDEEKAEKDQRFWETAQELGVAEYGTTGRSTRDLSGDIMGYAYKLFAALTNNKSPPTDEDDLLVDYIRPSREFRKGLMLEVDHRRRLYINNILHDVSVAIDDMMEIIAEIEGKAEAQ